MRYNHNGNSRNTSRGIRGDREMCEICSAIVYNLEAHIQNMHNQDFQCKFCGKTFANKGNCTRHEYLVHDGSNSNGGKFHCQTCEKYFDCEENLQKHIKIKHQSMKFKCNHCGKYFTQQSNRTRHVKMMHEKKLNWAKYEQPQNCHICGKMISTKSNFIRHMKTIHKGIKPKIEHEFCICDFCGKGFNQSSNFTRHLRLDHTNEANIELYKCVTCNKFFKSIASRKQHNTLSHNN